MAEAWKPLRIEHLPPTTDEDVDALLTVVRRKVTRLFDFFERRLQHTLELRFELVGGGLTHSALNVSLLRLQTLFQR